MLTSYGWSEKLRNDFAPYAAEGLAPARILIQHRGGYRLITEAGETDGLASGRLLRTTSEADRPATGDWVAGEVRPHGGEGGQFLVQHLLPRTTAFIKGPVARASISPASVMTR